MRKKTAQERELDALDKYLASIRNPFQQKKIEANKGSPGWKKGYSTAWRARKALRHAGRK